MQDIVWRAAYVWYWPVADRQVPGRADGIAALRGVGLISAGIAQYGTFNGALRDPTIGLEGVFGTLSPATPRFTVPILADHEAAFLEC
jgi:hypothetical protein